MDSFPDKPLYSFVVASSRTSYRWNEQSSSSTDISLSESDNSDELPSREENEFSVLCHLQTERFKINRRKLETMIKTASSEEGLNSAEFYFEKIMKTTDTFITWPRNLKIGARTRKDPYIRIDGKPHDIAWAKGLILAKLATSGPLLKMKMIISKTDHVHIIGRAGCNVNSIMEATDINIHFPSSNRSTSLEKSHQVTLYGELKGLEQARISLRASEPILMSFELPTGTNLPRYDVPHIKQLETDFNVKIIFMSIPRHTSYFAIVKGIDGEIENLKQAVRLLINLTCGAHSAQTLLNIKLEISKDVFDMSIAESLNLTDLKEKTQTEISLPDTFESIQEIPVIITGAIDGVYEAKKEIMSCMPVELTFDIMDPTYTSEIMSLGMKYGLSISVKHKRDNSATITMKTAEKYITHIYAANEEVLDMQNTFIEDMQMPRAYLLIEPAFRGALENSLNNKSPQFEDVSTKIWAPIESIRENSSIQGTQPSSSFTSALSNGLEVNLEPVQEMPPDSMDSFSSDTTDSEDAYQCGRSSSDWAVIKEANDDIHHSECNFDADDLEVAFILSSSSPNNFSAILSNTPGAEREYRQ